MRFLRMGLATTLFVACCLAAPAKAAAVDPAEIAPADSLFYVQIGEKTTQEAVAMAAMPPVAGLVGGGAGMGTPFGYLERLLSLPPGAVGAAAPHLRGVALAMEGDSVFALLSFDEADSATSLLQGKPTDARGVAVRAFGPISAGAREGVLVIGTDDACARIAAGDYAPLTDDAAFREARQGTEEAAAWGYAAAPQLIAKIREEIHGNELAELNAFFTATGLDSARYAMVKTSGLPEPEATRLTVAFDNGQARLLELASSEPIGVAAHVPGRTAALALIHWGDAGAFFGGIRDIVLDMDDQIGGGALRMQLPQMEQGFGFKLDDLYASIDAGGAAWLYGAKPDALIEPQDWAAVLLLKDGPSFEGYLNALLFRGMAAPPAEATAGGLPVRRLGDAPAFYAVAQDRLVVGGSPETIGRYLDWVAAGREQNEADEGTPNGALYVRLDTGILLTSYPAPEPGTKGVVRLAREGSSLVLRAGVEDFDPAQMQKVMMHAYPLLLMRALMPAISRARQEARGAAGQSKLHQIGLALVMYSHDHDGAFPDTLAGLVSIGYLDSPGVLQDPSDGSPPLIQGTNVRCSYEYVGPLMQKAPDNVIVCYTRPGIGADTRSVLNRDMVVMRASEDTLTNDLNDNPRTSLRASYETFLFDARGELTAEEQARLREFYGVEE